MPNRPLLKFILFICFAVVIAGALVYNRTACGQKRSEIDRKINLLKGENSVQQILLSKTFPGSEINLVADTILIKDRKVIDKIRQAITQTKSKNWPRTPDSWFVNLTIIINTNDRLTVRASKTKGDTTHLSFADSNCFDEDFLYSTMLNDLLENIASYEGKTFK